jgi:hypothetical protein
MCAKIRLALLIITINIFIGKVHIDIDIVGLNNKYTLNNKYIFITEMSGGDGRSEGLTIAQCNFCKLASQKNT